MDCWQVAMYTYKRFSGCLTQKCNENSRMHTLLAGFRAWADSRCILVSSTLKTLCDCIFQVGCPWLGSGLEYTTHSQALKCLLCVV